jgi:glycolate dehydrogenase iron-sulfur subunit
MSELKLLKEEIEKCVRCGTCRSVCPTFRVIGRESASARGKLTLIRSYMNNEFEQSDDYLKHIKECTLCGACRTSCPNGVNTTGIISAARADYVEKKGMPAAASLVFKTLLESSSPLILRLATKVQGLFFRDASIESGLLSRFSLPLVGNGRLMPPLAKTFFLDLPEVKNLSGLKGGPKGKPRVAFYAGCGVNYLEPNVGVASIDVLKRAGAEVVVPPGQVCCGMPAYSMGDVGIARSIRLHHHVVRYLRIWSKDVIQETPFRHP